MTTTGVRLAPRAPGGAAGGDPRRRRGAVADLAGAGPGPHRTRDVTVEGTTIPRDDKVLLLYAAANRDPRQFGPAAGDLDVARRPDRILTFGSGAHFCLGAAAARLMGRVALEELLAWDSANVA